MSLNKKYHLKQPAELEAMTPDQLAAYFASLVADNIGDDYMIVDPFVKAQQVLDLTCASYSFSYGTWGGSPVDWEHFVKQHQLPPLFADDDSPCPGCDDVELWSRHHFVKFNGPLCSDCANLCLARGITVKFNRWGYSLLLRKL